MFNKIHLYKGMWNTGKTRGWWLIYKRGIIEIQVQVGRQTQLGEEKGLFTGHRSKHKWVSFVERDLLKWAKQELLNWARQEPQKWIRAITYSSQTFGLNLNLVKSTINTKGVTTNTFFSIALQNIFPNFFFKALWGVNTFQFFRWIVPNKRT